MILRTTRGQVLVHDYDLVLPDTERIIGDKYDENKKVFIMAFQQGTMIQEKLKRVMSNYDNECFYISPENLQEEKNMTIHQKEETRSIIVQSKMMFRDFLKTADKKGNAEVSVFKMYKLFIQRESQIYSTLNMFKTDSSSNITTGLAWCPTSFKLDIKLNELRT